MFASQGIDVGESYGSSETAVVAMTRRGQWRPGETGAVCADVEVRLADDGEILIRSPTQMTGYFGDVPLTGEALTSDGFIKTGDLGELTALGALRLIGRKKEILNAPDGTNIAAVPIENLIGAIPWVEQVVLIGDARPFVAALIAVRGAPHSAEPDSHLPETEHASLYERARRDLEAINARLERVEQIRSFALFGRPFAPSMYAELGLGKVRRDRAAIATAYHTRIEALYCHR